MCNMLKLVKKKKGGGAELKKQKALCNPSS